MSPLISGPIRQTRSRKKGGSKNRKPGPYKDKYTFPESTKKKAARGVYTAPPKPAAPPRPSRAGKRPGPYRTGLVLTPEKQRKAVRVNYRDASPAERAKLRKQGGATGRAIRAQRAGWKRFDKLAATGEQMQKQGKFRTGRTLTDDEKRARDAYVKRERKQTDSETKRQLQAALTLTPGKLDSVKKDGKSALNDVREAAKLALLVSPLTAGPAIAAAATKTGPVRKAKDKAINLTADAVQFALDENVKRGTGLKGMQAAGFQPGETVANAAAAAAQGTDAFITDRKTRGATVRSAPGHAKATVGGLINLAANPKTIRDLPKAMQDDWDERGGKARKDPEAFRKELQKRGALPELADASVLVTGGGATAGRTVTALAKTGQLRKFGKAGRAIERVATAPRAKVRVSGNMTKEQALSPNAFRAAAQKGKDKARASAEARRVRKSPQGVDLRSGDGEVTLLTKRARKRAQRRDTGGRLTMANVSSKAQSTPELADRRKVNKQAKKGLTRKQAALYDALDFYALEQTVNLASKAKAKASVERHAKFIETKRKAEAVEAAKDGKRPYRVTSDEIKQLDGIKRQLDEMPDSDAELVLARLAERQPGEVARSKRITNTQDGLLKPETVDRRANRPKAEVLGIVDEIDSQMDAAPRSARRALDAERRAAINVERQAEKRVQRAIRADAKLEGKATVLTQQAQQRALRQSTPYRRATSDLSSALKAHKAKPSKKTAKQVADARATQKQVRAKVIADGEKHLRAKSASNLPGSNQLNNLTGRAPKTTLRDYARAAADLYAAKENLKVKREARETLGKKTYKQAEQDKLDYDETVAQLIRAAEREASAAEGLQEGVHIRHRDTSRGGSGDHIVNTRMKPTRKSNMTLLRMGDRDTSPAAIEGSIAATTKRSHEAGALSDIQERHALADPSTGRPRTYTASQVSKARRDLQQMDLDPAQWRLQDVGVTRRVADDIDDVNLPRGRTDDLAGQGDAAVNAEMERGTFTLDGDPGKFKQTSAMVLIPAEVADELARGTRPAGKAIRGAQKAQALTSRWILSTSPQYVPVNVGSNVILVGMGAPMAFFNQGMRWRSKLSPQSKQWLDKYIGQSPSADVGTAPHFGNYADNGVAKAYQAFADADIVRNARSSKLNPLTWNYRVDARQNHWFRTNHMYRKMQADLKAPVNTAIVEGKAITDILEMPDSPEKMRLLRKAEPHMERYADATDEILGNWTKYTANERRFAKTGFLFYGFLRFSLRLSFYTLPVKHPVATSILAKLGALRYEELVDLLGSQFMSEEEYSRYTKEEVETAIRSELMNSMGGYIFLTGGDNALMLDTSKINPATGPFLDLLSAIGAGAANPNDPATREQLLTAGAGMMTPLLKSPVEALLGHRLYGGMPIQTRGKMFEKGKDPEVGGSELLRIITRDFFKLNPVLRASIAAGEDGQRGDDSVPLVGDRPLKPRQGEKGEETTQEKKVREKQEVGGNARGRALAQGVPGVKQSDPMERRIKSSVDFRERERIDRELHELDIAGKKGGKRYKELLRRRREIEHRRKGTRPKPKKTSSGLGGGLDGGLGGGL